MEISRYTRYGVMNESRAIAFFKDEKENRDVFGRKYNFEDNDKKIFKFL